MQQLLGGFAGELQVRPSVRREQLGQLGTQRLGVHGIDRILGAMLVRDRAEHFQLAGPEPRGNAFAFDRHPFEVGAAEQALANVRRDGWHSKILEADAIPARFRRSVAD